MSSNELWREPDDCVARLGESVSVMVGIQVKTCFMTKHLYKMHVKLTLSYTQKYKLTVQLISLTFCQFWRFFAGKNRQKVATTRYCQF